ncbi:MAG: YbjQ family protein [Dictyoglomus sp.]|nr:YbjQ family protein [Dictyoglomus sp.]MCX7941596.1 YbjQ family protein [Dictyoglomaceae bacterium]MDW8187785.1 YbjQ family protein [Dictyoglomus sp.]
MIITTTDHIPGYEIIEIIGIVKGSSARARHLGKDILAALRNIVGGEVLEYTKLIGESREQAIERMIQEAENLGADAIIGVRFGTTQIMQGVAEILAYGTAVKLKKKE